MKYYNDYELLYLINENDEIAKDILKRKYAPLIYEKSKEYYQRNHYDIPSFSFDELINLGNSVLLRATKTYNEKENALFYTYFITCLAREFSLYKRGLLAKKNQILYSFPHDVNSYEINDYIKEEVKWDDDPCKICEENELFEFIKQYMYKLEGYDRKVFELRYNGFKYREIAELLELSTTTVGKIVEKLKKILQQELKKEW